tara:strand:+ start:3133 stop:3450 length:318 start_codon:yes stop_codon:yes gene_type:complete
LDPNQTLVLESLASGWSEPKLSSCIEKAMSEGSLAFFNKPCCFIEEGKTNPFMSMVGNQFRDAQFLITKVLRPDSNNNGPNEFLHFPYAKKLTAKILYVLKKFSS